MGCLKTLDETFEVDQMLDREPMLLRADNYCFNKMDENIRFGFWMKDN